MAIIYDKMLQLLSRPPSRSGLRLKSERELARIFNVNPRSTNYALSLLEKDGIIERRQGSGSFVRKIPFLAPALPDEPVKIDPFITSVEGNWLQESEKPMRHFEIALWGVCSDGWADAELRRGIIERLKRDGHGVTSFAPNTMRRQLEECGLQFDASLVFTQAIDEFQTLGFPASHPLLYIADGNQSSVVSPIARYDFFEMFDRGAQLFRQNGIRRVAGIGLSDYARRVDAVNFEWACRVHQLECLQTFDCRQETEAVREAADRIFPAGRPELWPEGLFVSDNIIMHLVWPFLYRNGLRPGENVAVITHSNQGDTLPPPYDWSRLEFQPYRFGRHCAETLLRPMLFAGEDIELLAMSAHWIAGETLTLKQNPRNDKSRKGKGGNRNQE